VTGHRVRYPLWINHVAYATCTCHWMWRAADARRGMQKDAS
jgi:hypothetical protein